MVYGIKLKKFDRVVRGFRGSKKDAERMKEEYEKKGIKAQIIMLKGKKARLEKVV